MVSLCYYPKTGSFATGFVPLAFGHGFVVLLFKIILLIPFLAFLFSLSIFGGWVLRLALRVTFMVGDWWVHLRVLWPEIFSLFQSPPIQVILIRQNLGLMHLPPNS